MSKTATKLPAWLILDSFGGRITLSLPASINGMQVDQLAVRAPTLNLEHAAQAQAGGDPAREELLLFASLCETGEKDLGALPIRDYKRVQAAYSLMVKDPDEEAPAWLDVSLERARVDLHTPIEVDGQQLTQVSLRSPSINESRAAETQSGGDEARLEVLLFAILSGRTEEQLRSLSLRDFRRLRHAYFRLVDEDGV